MSPARMVSHQSLLSEWVTELGAEAGGRDSAAAARSVGADDADRQRRQTYAALMHDWLRARWAMQRHAEKRLARAVGCSPRTVENWLRGLSAPSGEQLLNLMAECDGLAEDIMAEVRRRQRSRLP